MILLWGLIFHYFYHCFAIKGYIDKYKQFGFQFYSSFKELRLKVYKPQRMCGYIVDFLSIEFDTLKMEARFL